MNLFKVTKFDFINIISNPFLVFFNIIYPLITIGIFGFITKGGYGESTITSYDYYGVTMVIFTALYIALTAANTFMEKTTKKGNLRLIYSPTSKDEIFLSKILSTFILGGICYTAVLIIENFIFRINCGGKNFIYVVLVILSFTLLMCAVGAFMCSVCKSEEVANKTLSPICLLLSLLGGSFFPVESLGKTAVNFSYISPVKWVNECVFKIIYDNDLSMILPTVLICLAGAIVFMLLCKIFFKPEEYV